MKLHRARFGERTLAELRGVMDEAGNAPFWDALAGRFFDMSFPQADEFNAVHGTRFIADLMPRTPIYVALLERGARAVMGQPHPSGRAALRMLEEEGFYFERYIDIFDGGPTVTARHRRNPHHPRIDARDGLRDRRRRQGQGARRGGPAQGFPRLLRERPEAAEEGRVHRPPRPPSCSKSRSATKW